MINRGALGSEVITVSVLNRPVARQFRKLMLDRGLVLLRWFGSSLSEEASIVDRR
jgi:hypothetical protein